MAHDNKSKLKCSMHLVLWSPNALNPSGNPGSMASSRLEKEDKSKPEKTFEYWISSTFTAMQEDIEGTTKETNTYIGKILGLMDQLEELHLRRHARFQITKEHSSTNKDKFDGLFSTCSSLLYELAPRRMQIIQAGEEASQIQSARMRESRKNTMNITKRRLDESREKQQLATDASELMTHYKALVMAT